MGIAITERGGAGAIVDIQVRSITFAAQCIMPRCGARAVISVRPIDYIGRPATADLLVCSAHADALKARAIGKGIHVLMP